MRRDFVSIEYLQGCDDFERNGVTLDSSIARLSLTDARCADSLPFNQLAAIGNIPWKPDRDKNAFLSPSTAAAIASCALTVPLALSISSTPSPNHPQTMRWYRSLREPQFKPPDGLFPIAWTGIETALAVSAYRLLRAAPSVARSKALAFWGWNVLMIGGWSRLFFKRHNLGLSTVASAGLLATSVAFVSQAQQVDRQSARAGLPLVGWVVFATVLTATIWHLNRPQRR